MDKFFELFGKRMEDIFIRSIMPSSMSFVLLIIYDHFFNNNNIIDFLFNHFTFSTTGASVNTSLVFMSVLVFLLGYGYIVSLIQQFLDDFIKKDYDANIFIEFFFHVNKPLGELRDLVRNKLSQQVQNDDLDIVNMTDYDLYQLLGNTKIFRDNNIGRRYVDQTKIIFSFFIALSIILFIYFIPIINLWYFFLWLFGTGFLFWISIGMATSRYRARNIRLYLNYILDMNPTGTTTLPIVEEEA